MMLSEINMTFVEPGDTRMEVLLQTAALLNQEQYISRQYPYAEKSLLIGAFEGTLCVGFLRFLVQVIGSDEGRQPIFSEGEPLREGFVEAFGVLPEWRRQGIGQKMQEKAICTLRERGCYQIRSRSPISSTENYALKIKMGYAVHPSNKNDSYFFIKTLHSGEF